MAQPDFIDALSDSLSQPQPQPQPQPQSEEVMVGGKRREQKEGEEGEAGEAGEADDSPVCFFSETIPPNEELYRYYLVYLNGSLIGVIPRGDAPSQFVRWLREQRVGTRQFTMGVSVDHADRRILINTDAGRLLVPFIPARFITDPAKREELNAALRVVSRLLEQQETEAQAWEHLLTSGVVELLDPVMVGNAVVAQSIEDLLSRPSECTHLQLPCSHCGLIASLSCSIDMTRGAKAILSTNYWKQGTGNTVLNPFSRYLGEVNLLRGAQRPLVRSAFNSIIGIDRYPFCQNVDVAFLAMADNQSDALVFNQAAIDRGAFIVHHIEYQMIVPDSPNAAFGLPDFTRVYAPVAPMEAYLKVDPVLGTPTTLGQRFQLGDVIAAITKPLEAVESARLSQRHAGVSGAAAAGVSGAAAAGASGAVTGAAVGEGHMLVDVSVRNMVDHCPNERHPTYSRLVASFSSIGQDDRVRLLQFATTRFTKPGDKMSAEHAQKGICGHVLDEWEVPYNEDGIRATIVFNPPSILRRDTPGQLTFALLGKICSLYGTSLDHTPFLNRVDNEEMSGLLEQLGMNRDGTEVMYDPTTGNAFTNPICFGVLAYMRLRRMVDDLVQYRYNGPREWFSHMAVKGRMRRGGVKYDEQTRNATLAAGAMLTSRDCMFTQAAPAEYQICDKCHQFAYPSPTTPGLVKCDRCGLLDPAVSHTVRIPYNAALLYSILAGAGCTMEMLTDSACNLDAYLPEDEPNRDASSAAHAVSSLSTAATAATAASHPSSEHSDDT